MLKRQFKIPLHKQHGKPWIRIKPNHLVYIHEGSTMRQKKEPISIILTKDVVGIGRKGDKILERPWFAYHNLLIPGFAVYPSPDNVDKYMIRDKTLADSVITVHAETLLYCLSRFGFLFSLTLTF